MMTRHEFASACTGFEGPFRLQQNQQADEYAAASARLGPDQFLGWLELVTNSFAGSGVAEKVDGPGLWL